MEIMTDKPTVFQFKIRIKRGHYLTIPRAMMDIEECVTWSHADRKEVCDALYAHFGRNHYRQ